MVTEAYRAYLKSDKWKAKRQAVFKHYGKRCYACRKQAKVLHVHHLTYERLGNEAMSKLGVDGEPIYREDGKVLKGPYYQEPDIERVLHS